MAGWAGGIAMDGIKVELVYGPRSSLMAIACLPLGRKSVA